MFLWRSYYRINHDLVTQDGYFDEHNRFKTIISCGAIEGLFKRKKKEAALCYPWDVAKAQVMPSGQRDTFV